MKVLIVDDSKAMRMIARRSLAREGFRDWEVLDVASGLEALREVKTFEPDLILSDWHMPQMGGLDLLRILNSSGTNPKLGFITSDASPEVKEAALKDGALFVLIKPIQTGQLRRAIEQTVLSGAEGDALGNSAGSSARAFPTDADVRLLLSDLLSKRIVSDLQSPFDCAAGGPFLTGIYRGGQGDIEALCLADLGFAASAAAALTLFPRAMVEKSISTQALTEPLEDNAREVFNVLGGLFPTLWLAQLCMPQDPPPADLLAQIKKASTRLDLRLSITGYEAGRLSFLRVP